MFPFYVFVLQGVRFDPDQPQTIRLEFAKSNTKVTKPKQTSPQPANLPMVGPHPAQLTPRDPCEYLTLPEKGEGPISCSCRVHTFAQQKKNVFSKKGYQPKYSVMLTTLDWLPGESCLAHKFGKQYFPQNSFTTLDPVHPGTM